MGVIEVEGLRKSYGSLTAVDGVDLHVDAGEVFALLGPNGAGKTTTVEILEGYRKSDSGTVSVLGRDPADATPEWRARIGIVPQGTGMFEQLTPRELITHYSHFYDNPRDPLETIELVGLTDKRDDLCNTLSGGQQRKIDLALGIIGRPELVFLDEPTTGLDPQARRQVWTLIEQMTSLGTTVLLTTHYLDEAERLADRVAVIANGVIVAEGTPRDIGGRSDAIAIVRFERRGPLGAVDVPPLADAVSVVANAAVVEIETERPTAVIAALTEWARTHDADELPALSVARPTLEDTYLRLIGTQERADV